MKWIFIFFHSLDQLFPPSTATLFLFHSTTFTLVPSFLTPSSLPTSLRPYIPHLLHRISCPLPNPITPSSSLHSTSHSVSSYSYLYLHHSSIYLPPTIPLFSISPVFLLALPNSSPSLLYHSLPPLSQHIL
uniref:Uncharacterized protein n=1 Tax=Cacopsylla melanoneura TaxID=428564 RepID=A0A8D8ZC04_9HEMI